MARAETLEVGRISKAHGLHGDVVVDLWTNREERMDPGSVLESDRGPLTVVRSSHEGRGYLVRFEEISSRSAAESFRGVVLRATRLTDDSVIWIDDLFGATVIDQLGIERGVVAEVEANPASDLLVLDTGFLVPLNFVVDIEPGVRVTVSVPEGLFDVA
jgi:16S rRNA processing protein RimM